MSLPLDTSSPAPPQPAGRGAAQGPGSAPRDIRLVVADMDGTLLDGQGAVPPRMWPLLDRMRAAGIVFTPASGRQYATLAQLFAGREGLAFIAENGTYVVRDGVEVSSDTVDPAVVRALIARLRELAADPGDPRDLGVVVCGKRSAYIERTDPAFRAEADTYYKALAEVADLSAVDDDVLKVAIYDFGDAESGTAPRIADFGDTHQVVVSGPHWIDVMNQGVDKGVAVRRLQRDLGVTADQTVAFGDYLNDVQMLGAATHSYAMANAHPDVLAVARHRAPANTDEGVITVLQELLG